MGEENALRAMPEDADHETGMTVYMLDPVATQFREWIEERGHTLSAPLDFGDGVPVRVVQAGRKP